MQRMMTNDDGSVAAGAGACRTSIADISDVQVGRGPVLEARAGWLLCG